MDLTSRTEHLQSAAPGLLVFLENKLFGIRRVITARINPEKTCKPTLVILVVGLTPSLIGEDTPNLRNGCQRQGGRGLFRAR